VIAYALTSQARERPGRARKHGQTEREWGARAGVRSGEKLAFLGAMMDKAMRRRLRRPQLLPRSHIRVREQRVKSRIAPNPTQQEINTHSTVEVLTVIKRHALWPTQGRAEILQLGGSCLVSTVRSRLTAPRSTHWVTASSPGLGASERLRIFSAHSRTCGDRVRSRHHCPFAENRDGFCRSARVPPKHSPPPQLLNCLPAPQVDCVSLDHSTTISSLACASAQPEDSWRSEVGARRRKVR